MTKLTDEEREQVAKLTAELRKVPGLDATANVLDLLVVRLEAAERERDFLVGEYERAVGCGPQGFAHAAGHLYNAILNIKCSAKAAVQQSGRATRASPGALGVANGWKERAEAAEREVEFWKRADKQHREERDALAAHVEALKQELIDVREDYQCKCGHPSCRIEKQRRAMDAVIDAVPETSFARRDLLERADELERLFIESQTDPQWGDGVLPRIRELRRQAEPNLCVDEGCPHHGTDHVCINRQVEDNKP